MKKNLHTIIKKAFIALFVCCLISPVFAVQLSGNYTINPAATATGSNFQNFASAITYLTSASARTDGGPANSGTFGVSGPVVFQVAAATYSIGTTGISVPAITGSSTTNTVTFDGGIGNAVTRVITGNIANGGATFVFNGCQYVTIRNLTITNTSTQYAGGVTIVGSSSSAPGSFNNIKSCIINLPNGGGSTGYGTGISINYSNYSMAYSYSTTYCNDLEIDSNVLNNGYYGIGMYGASSASYNANIKIRNNTLNNMYYNGLYMQYIYNGFDFLNNNITMQTGSSNPYVMYLAYCLNSSTTPQRISGNRLRNCGYMGIYYYSTGSTSAPTQFYNNMIAGGFTYNSTTYGIISNYSSASVERYYHNTIWLDNPTSNTGYGLQTSATDVIARNNIFFVSGSGTNHYPAYFANSVSGNMINYNEYYNQSGTNLVYRGGTTYNSSNYRTATAGGDSSFNVNILSNYFNSLPDGDLHVQNACSILKGGNFSAILTTDYDGNTRPAAPELGCDEFYSTSNDIGVMYTNITLPVTGSNYIMAKFKNTGTSSVSSFDLNLRINGTIISTYNYSGTLTPCAADSFIFTIPYTFNPRQFYNVEVFSSNPNFSQDLNTANDTLKQNFYGALDGGAYTIDAAGSGAFNFTSFAEVTSILNNGGILGPVVFNVAPGTYFEQVTLNGVKGVSASNTITFDGGTATSTEIEYGQNNSSNAHTLQINNTPYVTVRNFTIRGTGAYGVGVHITGASNSTKVKNCIITLVGAAEVSQNQYFTGIAMSSSFDATGMLGGSVKLDSCEIDSNYIKSGYAGIVFYGQTSTPYSLNNKFRYNTIDSIWYYGMYVYYMNGMNTTGNKVNMRSGNVNAIGMYLYVVATANPNTIVVHNNKVFGYGQMGMYLYLSSTSLTNRIKVTNNVISGSRNNNSYGMYVLYPYNTDFYHNTIVNEMLTTGNYGPAYFNTTSSTNIKNNYFIGSSPNAASQALYLASMSGTLNYNNYYMANSSSPLLYVGGTYYNRSNFIGGGGYNLNSKNRNVPFVSLSNLRISDGCALNGDSTLVSTLAPLDFDGMTRSVFPDMGAYEVPSAGNDMGIDAIISPVFPIATGSQPISVRIKNMGSTIVTSCTVNYSVNGGSPQSIFYFGTLNPCDTTTLTFTTPYTFNAGSSYSLKVYTESPNFGVDTVGINDTIIAPICTAMNGSYTINASGSGINNFPTFNDAINRLSCGGISGPVTFDVASGIYNEQVTFGGVNGTSATNSITFQSITGNSADVTVQYAPANNLDNWTVRFFYSQYVKLKGMTLRSNGATNNYTSVIYMAGGNSYDTIEACKIIAPISTTTGTNCALVYQTGTTDDYNVFLNDSLYNGSFGYYFSSNTSVRSKRNVIRGNYITNQYYMGMYYFYYHDSIKIVGNTIDLNTPYTGTTYGIYTQTTWNRSEISNNRINVKIGGSAYGIYNTSWQGGTIDTALVFNNMVTVQATSTAYGIYVTGNGLNARYYNNSVNILTSAATNSFAGYFSNTSATYTNKVINNIFTNQVTGTAATIGALYLANATYNPSNYNNLYTASTTYLASLNGTGYTTLAAWRLAAGTPDLLSKNVKVDYENMSLNNLRNITPCLIGAGAILSSVVSKDIDGNVRPTVPTIGANEVVAQAYDAQISAITAPTAYSSSGQTVTFKLANKGTTTITSIDLSYAINGGTPVNELFTSLTLASCQEITLSFAVPASMPAGAVGLKVFVNGMINFSSNDGNSLNDTIGKFYCSVLGGTYSINPALAISGTNFQSFGTALAALNSCGVNAPVVFNVAPAIYNEQLTIGTTAIVGVSATNTISFNGADSNTCILRFTGSSAAYHVLRIDGVGGKFITFRNLHIENTSPQYGFGVMMYSTATATPVNNIRFIRCTIKSQSVTTTTVVPVVMSGSTTSATSTGDYLNTITIDSCSIHGGYYGITSFGNTSAPYANNVAIKNCDITGQYQYAIYTSYTSNMTISNNKIYDIGAIFNYTAPRGMYLINSASPTLGSTITGNRIYGFAGGYGIFTTSFAGLAASHVVIANNMIQIGNGSTNTSVGLYNSSGGNYYDVVYNSININSSASSTNTSAMYYSTAPTNTVVLNNNFVINNSTNGYTVYFQPTSTTYFTNVNNNNYYGGAYINGYTTLASFKSSMYAGSDLNSVSVAPGYTSGNNLHSNAFALNNVGTPFAAVTTDFDGEARHVTTPDIGCDEFTLPSNDLSPIAIFKPTNPLSAGLQDVWVLIKNMGVAPVTTANVSYKVGTSAAVTFPWTGTLAPNAIDTVKFTGIRQYNFSAGTSTIMAYTDGPNSSIDANMINDTIRAIVCGGMSGVYTINPAGSGASNFTSFNAAVTGLYCGVTGPVTFNIAPGTYTEQISIVAVAGASAVNNITFQSASGNAADVTLRYSSTASNNYVVRLDGADYITLNRLTLVAQNTVNGRVVDLKSSGADHATNNNITNCNIMLSNYVSSTGVPLALIASDQNAYNPINTVIRGNTFNNGAYAIYINSTNNTTGLVIDSNIINNGVFYMGIYLYYCDAPQITRNIIYGNPNYSNYYGIYSYFNSNAANFSSNVIQVPGGGWGMQIYYLNASGQLPTAQIVNNAISVGGSSGAPTYGILFQYGGNTDILNNSIYLYGVGGYNSTPAPAGISTYGQGTGSFNNKLTIMNNSIYNTTSGATALYLGGSSLANSTALIDTCNYNNYAGNVSDLFNIYGSTYSTLGSFLNQVYTGNDVNSFSGNPYFTSSSNLKPNGNAAGSWVSNGNGLQMPGRVIKDITGANRSTSVIGGGIDIGAYEFRPTTAPVAAVASPATPVASSTQVFTVWGKQMASITWGSAGTVPSSVVLKYYPGSNPPDSTNCGTNPNAKYMNSFWNISATGGSSFTYNVTLNYSKHLLGTVVSETNLRMAKKDVPCSWNYYPSSVVNSTSSTLTYSGLTGFSDFTGTDNANPLPVNLMSFDAMKNGKDALITWSTATEINSNYFEVQRSFDGIDFTTVGKVKAKGNSSISQSYLLSDVNPMINRSESIVYYRLKMVDKDNSYAYSNMIELQFKNIDQSGLNIMPNPFSTNFDVMLNAATEGNSSIRLVDIQGRTVQTMQYLLKKGENKIEFANMSNLPVGIYFVEIVTGNEKLIGKLVKVE